MADTQRRTHCSPSPRVLAGDGGPSAGTDIPRAGSGGDVQFEEQRLAAKQGGTRLLRETVTIDENP